MVLFCGGLSQFNKGSRFEPSGVTCDEAGRVYVVESCDRWLIVLDGVTGARLQVLRIDESWGLINDICYSHTKSQLVLLHDIQLISFYNLL